MEITCDPVKSASNIELRGLSFERVADFDFQTAVFEVDDRRDYGESRMTAIGRLDGIPHVLVFTMRGETLRVISFRKANKREVRRYEQATQP
ncbi:BrnT family toxin [Propionivibrio sp.]|uniref:BrnT family toxin n=1 Tax=Propionivibrio sp. TaxID=2212460 RepID=UPI00261F9246|nr:BrnT family toxin [Propionivibrio sp.]